MSEGTARKSSRVRALREDPWMSLGDAARELGYSRQTVLARALAGELEAKVIAKRTVVSRASVERLRSMK